MAVAAMAQDNDDPDLASSLLRALQLRSTYLTGQADSLTLPAVRRLLERDLGLGTSHLDAHKALIKRLVDKVLNGAGNDGEEKSVVTEMPRKRRKKSSRVVEDLQDEEDETHRNNDEDRDMKMDVNIDQEKSSKVDEEKSEDQDHLPGNAGERDGDKPESQTNAVEEPTKEDERLSEKQGDVQEEPINADKQVVENEEETEDNLATKEEETEVYTQENQTNRNEETPEGNGLPRDTEEKQGALGPLHVDVVDINEDAIKSALMKRADELKAQAESLTVKTVRQLIEKDLGLGPAGLDVHKQFIRRLVDQLLGDSNDEPIVNPPKLGKAKMEVSTVHGRGKLKKKGAVKSPSGKKSVHVEEAEESEQKLQGNGEVLESDSEDKTTSKAHIRKKKTTDVKAKTVLVKKSTDVKRPFSANVERLREILKTVGLGVSPIVYKKAKQAPEHEREEVLVKELESRLRQEGLSPNPTEKEIRKVKAHLQKKRDLDGIEHSNIVAEPRRSRAAANSWFAPRQNKYSDVVDIGDNSEEEGSGDNAKPMVTGAMDD